jgi:hypothetical protein
MASAPRQLLDQNHEEHRRGQRPAERVQVRWGNEVISAIADGVMTVGRHSEDSLSVSIKEDRGVNPKPPASDYSRMAHGRCAPELQATGGSGNMATPPSPKSSGSVAGCTG